MKFEQTIQTMLDFGSSLFLTRKDCLDHLFCAIGTGYKWVNGELVSSDYAEQIARYEIKSVNKAVEITDHIEAARVRDESRHRIAEERKDKLPKILYDNAITGWYPLSKSYSYLYNYPEDIKPDWLAGIEECKQMLINDGIDI